MRKIEENLCAKFLASDERGVFDRFKKLLPLDSKVILEVGGSISNQLIENLPIEKWISVDPAYTPNNLSPLISFKKEKNFCLKKTFIQAEASEINLPKESIDYIFSCNAFQHIGNLSDTLKKLHSVLKKGGYLYSHFGPIWSGPDGSHIEGLIVDKNRYDFWTHTLIPSWSHLIFSPKELYELISTAHDETLSRSIVDYTYNSKWINRLFYEDYFSQTHNGDWDVLSFRMSSVVDYNSCEYTMNHPLLERLRKPSLQDSVEALYGQNRNIHARDLEILLRKK